MVTCQYYTVGFADGYLASGFQCLGSFIDEKSAEAATVQYTVIAADKSGSYDVGRVE